MAVINVSLAAWGCLTLAVLWLVRAVARAFLSPLARIPGPWHSAITRLVLKYHIITGRRMHYVHALHTTYGPVVRIGPNEVAVASPDGFAQIHRIGSGFLKAPWYTEATGGPEPGIFDMIDPRQHSQRRKLFAKAFSNSSLRQNWEPVVREMVELAVSRIKAEARRGEADILKWWTFMTTDVMGRLSFGESFNMLQVGEKNQYIRTLESALIGSGIRSELPFLHAVARYIPLSSIQTMMNADEYLYEYGTKAVSNLRSGNSSSQNLFSNMLAACEDKESEELGDRSIRVEAGNLILAGSDTTSVTLTYLVWAVLKRPQLQSRLEEEVAGLAPDFDGATLEKLPLLNAIIDETLRLYGAAPGSLPRSVPPGGATLEGYFIPEGTVVETQAYTMHRNPDIFPGPLRFDENRFLDANVTPAMRKVFSPFGGGSRTCIGLHLARTELRLAAAVFFRECRGARLGAAMTDETMDMENHFLIAPVGHCCNITLC